MSTAPWNHEVFSLLINKVPLQRMPEVKGLSPQTLYDKFAFIHRQCLAFAASCERQLQKMVLPKLYLSTDRQTLAVNWSTARTAAT